MRNLTIRGVPSELARRLEEEKRARGRSLNQTVLDLLAQAVGLGGGRRSNGLAALAGNWTEDDVGQLESALRFTEEVDEELWR
jgi:hypothetical protein